MFVMLCGAGSFVALFVGSIIFGQVQAEVKNATATVVSQQTPTHSQAQPSQIAPIDSSNQSSDIQVSVESDAGGNSNPDQGEINIAVSTSTATPAPFVTNTPGLPPLGTLSYPMTVTAEYILEQTKVSDFRNQIGLTETAMSEESISIFATLTAGAPKRGK